MQNFATDGAEIIEKAQLVGKGAPLYLNGAYILSHLPLL